MKQKMVKIGYFNLIMGIIILGFFNCKKSDTTPTTTKDPIDTTTQTSVPTVTTTVISTIAETSAKSGGTIASDGGLAVTARGICWGTIQTPVITNSKTADGTGIGSFTSSITGLIANTTYYVRAYATNSKGTAYGTVISFKSAVKAVVYGSLIDQDGITYKTVVIGTQTWMAENLKTTKYNDGTAIPNVTGNSSWSALTTGALCDYDNTVDTSKHYGKIYNWYAVSTGILCPSGWHVPSESDFSLLRDSLGGELVAGGKLKETGTVRWDSPNVGATNITGFTAVAGGERTQNGDFLNAGSYGNWWTTKAMDFGEKEYFGLYHQIAETGYSSSKPSAGKSVRCIKN
jgi:uncharacterized protein (TIGR02145 family)